MTRGRWEALIRRLSFVFLCTAASYTTTQLFLSLLLPAGSLSRRPAWLPAGVCFGVFYSVHHLYFCHWMVKFPIIQRLFFFRLKTAFYESVTFTWKWAPLSALLEEVLIFIFEGYGKVNGNTWMKMLAKNVLSTSFVLFCWQLGDHLMEIIFTERHKFGPPLGSVEADRSPNAKLLEALEYNGTSFFAPWLRHLATFDLCHVAETNVDAWRRSALFDLGDSTYKRVIDSCLGNVNSLTEKITAVLGDKTRCDVAITVNTLDCLFGDFQLVSWSARASSSLTARSRSDDQMGAAQLTRSNSRVVSSLLSCLLALEALSDHLRTTRKPNSGSASVSRRRSWLEPLRRSNLYVLFGSVLVDEAQAVLPKPVAAMEDVLKGCIYRIVAVHGKEMGIGKTEWLVQRRGAPNWSSKEEPVFGIQEKLVAKLEQFVMYQA